MRRRTFIESLLSVGTLVSSAAGLTTTSCSTSEKKQRQDVRIQEKGEYEILLKGGHIIDPANNINSKMDVAVAKGKIADVDQNIPPSVARKTIDVTGFYVIPGIIDIHAHGFYTDFSSDYRWIIFDDICFPSGVTTVVDVGTSGVNNFEEFKKIIDRSKIRTLALLNISATGMNSGEQDPSQFKIPPLVEMAQQFPDIIVGFKTAHYWTTMQYDQIHTPWASVDAVIEAGRRADLPVMFDFYPRVLSGGYPARSYRELILEKGRPGDIHTHVFARHFPIIDKEGKINPDLFKAQERGFIFDVGHGAGSFVYKNAVPAIAQGFLPNSISTDLHGANTCGPVVNMINVMSKFLCMGVSLEDVIRLSTINPAREINRSELGTLSVGSAGDIAVIELLERNFSYTDTSAGKMKGNKKLQCAMTLSGGDIVYDPYGYSSPVWQNIPKDSDYWVNPSGQFW